MLVSAPAATARTPPPYQGIVGRENLVEIVVDERGVPQYADIEWRTRRCRNLETRIKGVYDHYYNRTGEGKPARATRRSLSGVYRTRGTLTRDRTYTATARVTGRRRGARWVGTIHAAVVFRRRGRVLERCGMRATRWRAGRHRASLTLSGGGWVGQGNSYAADHRSHVVRAYVVHGRVNIEWGGDDEGEPSFHASTVGSPRTGRTYRGHDAVDVGGDARGCGSDVQTGTLVVERSRLDRLGRVISLVATYEQRCNAEYDEAHRGRITFRRGW